MSTWSPPSVWKDLPVEMRSITAELSGVPRDNPANTTLQAKVIQDVGFPPSHFSLYMPSGRGQDRRPEKYRVAESFHH